MKYYMSIELLIVTMSQELKIILNKKQDMGFCQKQRAIICLIYQKSKYSRRSIHFEKSVGFVLLSFSVSGMAVVGAVLFALRLQLFEPVSYALFFGR